MFLIHYILPFVIYFFIRNRTILYGLLLGNLIDIDHILLRIIGKVPWFESACPSGLFTQCSFNVYPYHSTHSIILICLLFITIFLVEKKHKHKDLLIWISAGAVMHILLDSIHLLTGLGI
jgi:membrane-bound metal-dependent hydrolase YbcI (DUF457 family)